MLSSVRINPGPSSLTATMTEISAINPVQQTVDPGRTEDRVREKADSDFRGKCVDPDIVSVSHRLNLFAPHGVIQCCSFCSAVFAERRKEIVVDVDESPRPETTLEALQGLRTVFQKDGTVTAGNASTINDGAGKKYMGIL